MNTSPFHFSIFLRIAVISLLLLMLLIPLGLISDIVYERQQRQSEVVREISSLWGGTQQIIGPLLSVPYRSAQPDEKEKIYYARFLPDSLIITGHIEPEVRTRGIFEAVLYRLHLDISGEMPQPNLTQWDIQPEQIMWEDAILSIGISDTRGIRDALSLDWAGTQQPFLAGSGHNGLFNRGIHVRLPMLADHRKSTYSYQFNLSLAGFDNLTFFPAGKQTHITVQSSWPDPSFIGSFLPVEYSIDSSGFKADWQVSHLGRSTPQYWTTQLDNRSQESLYNTHFGVRLLLPVDFYQKTGRSVKYGILFLIVTFVTFFLFEVFNPLRIHPLQYLMVGVALCIFYLLLLSIAEHAGFAAAYLIASTATILLISAYGIKILRSWRRALIMGLTLAGLYLYLYFLLHLQDYALLFGSLGLFVGLAAVMYITRNVDWYTLGNISPETIETFKAAFTAPSVTENDDKTNTQPPQPDTRDPKIP